VTFAEFDLAVARIAGGRHSVAQVDVARHPDSDGTKTVRWRAYVACHHGGWTNEHETPEGALSELAGIASRYLVADPVEGVDPVEEGGAP
jgi:hypothetical protein